MTHYTDLNPGTKKAAYLIWDEAHANRGDIWEAYAKPSAAKVNSYRAIEQRAIETPGYNHDLRVVGASCHSYSTVYTYTDKNGLTYIVKDTKANTYRTIKTA